MPHSKARDPRFTFKDKTLIPRLNRLGHLPPALYATEILGENGHEVLVVEFGKVEKEETLIEGGIPKMRFRSSLAGLSPRKIRPLVIFFSTLLRLSWLCLTQGRPKRVLACGMQEHCIAYFLNRTLGIPFIAYVLEIYEGKELDRMNRVFYALLCRSLRHADTVLVPEKRRAEVLKKQHPVRSKIHLVFNCPRLEASVTPKDFRAKYQIPRSAKIMGYLGGIGPENAIEEGMVALIEVPDLYFVLWGWGTPAYLRRLKALAHELRVRDRVIFAGQISREEKASYLSSCSLSYCIYKPSLLRLKYAATASNKLMESLAAGVPVLCSNNEDFWEIVKGNDVGACLPEISGSAIATALKALFADPRRLKEMGENGRRLYEERFHYEYQFGPVLKSLEARSV